MTITTAEEAQKLLDEYKFVVEGSPSHTVNVLARSVIALHAAKTDAEMATALVIEQSVRHVRTAEVPREETGEGAMQRALLNYAADVVSLSSPTDGLALVAELRATNARLAAQVEALTEVLGPFKAMSCELFARNWNKDDVVIALDNPGEPHRLTFGDFLELHAALSPEGEAAPDFGRSLLAAHDEIDRLRADAQAAVALVIEQAAGVPGQMASETEAVLAEEGPNKGVEILRDTAITLRDAIRALAPTAGIEALEKLRAERDAFQVEMDRLQTKAAGAVDAARDAEATNARLAALVEALDMQVRNCPQCKGTGKSVDAFVWLMSDKGKQPEPTDCRWCNKGRTALSAFKGDPT